MYGVNPYFTNLGEHRQNVPPITQNFQIASNRDGLKYASNIEGVKNELVFNDTLFVDKEFSTLWYKMVNGTIKTYKLEEIIELDEKDKLIKQLSEKIESLEREIRNGHTKSNEFSNAEVTTE